MFKQTIKSEKGDITLLMILVLILSSFICITFIGLMGAMLQRHQVDASLEAATLAGASNVMRETDESFSRTVADAQAKKVYYANLKNNENGQKNANIKTKTFSSKVIVDNGKVWYYTEAIVEMPVTISILRYSLRYKTNCRAPVNNMDIVNQ